MPGAGATSCALCCRDRSPARLEIAAMNGKVAARQALPPAWMKTEICLPELVRIPAGAFIMGDDFGPREARPAHAVTLPDYWISRYPVTTLAYAPYMDAADRSEPGSWPSPVRWLEEADHPVSGVSWRDAMGYCDWLSAQTNRRVRLPTEAEWEKAATWIAETGEKVMYPWGNDFDPAYANTTESLIARTTPVDAYRVVGDSPYGVS